MNRDFFRRLAAFRQRDRLDRDLREEIQNHLAMQAEDNQRSGMDVAEARSAARRQFGNSTVLVEQSRETWGWGPFERLGQDLKYAWRTLRNNPAFTLVAILSLALGIGANTAIFSVVNAVLLRSLPVRDPSQLVILGASADVAIPGVRVQNSHDKTDPVTGRRFYNTFPLAVARDFRAKAADQVDAFAFFSPGKIGVNDSAGSRPGFLTLVSGNFFEALGAPMALGRGLTDADDQTGTSAIVITQFFWEHSLNSDAAILGKVLRLNGAPMVVVGVTGANFRGVSMAGFDGPADVFAPLNAMETIVPDEFRGGSRPKAAPDYWWVQILGRRRPGVSMQAAASRMTAIFRGTLADSGLAALQHARNPRILLDPGDKGLNPLRERIQFPLLILMVVVGVVLLLACVNIAVLQLARAAARQREMAVRLSLGAGRARIIRQLLLESLSLSALGAVAGMSLGAWGAPVIAHFLTALPVFSSAWLDLSPDLRIFGFTLLATVSTAALFGLTPAWQATGVDIASSLKDAPHHTSRRGAFRLGKMLIAGQTALSLILLGGSGLFLRTLRNLYHLDAGFDRGHLLLFRLDLRQFGRQPEQADQEFERILEAIQNVPGVRSAAAMSHLLIGGWNNSTELSSPRTNWQPVDTSLNFVTRDFFTTMRMPLVAGRTFQPSNAASTAPEVVINQSAARELFGGRPAVGQIIHQHTGNPIIDVQVAGVARDAKFNDLRREIGPTVFVPFASSYRFLSRAFAVRTSGDPLTIAGPIRRVIAAINKDLPMTDVKTQTALIDESLHQERLFAALLTLFGGFALLLAAIGLHGVTAYTTARRTSEIGIRVALGAQKGQVLSLVLRQVLWPVAVGAIAGLLVSRFATRWIESFLFGVKRLDTATFLAACCVLILVALAAAFGPAWRAARLDPMKALRAE